MSLTSNASIIIIILPVLKSKEESLISVSKVRFVGRELLLTIVLHCLLKKSLNKFAFVKKSVANRLPTNIGGIRGILELLTKVFMID